jgi:hypothetical protein
MDTDLRHYSDKSCGSIGRMHQHFGDVIWENMHSILYQPASALVLLALDNKL